MTDIELLLRRSAVHPQWHSILQTALAAVDAGYLRSLIEDPQWLPGTDRLLAAFQRDRQGLRYLLIGESPYPRAQSANGIAFQDAAVGSLWSTQGLSKAVNRATSLRNIVKTALLSEGHLRLDGDGKVSQQAIAAVDKSGLIGTLAELFDNLRGNGFLMLNATPVLHPARKPALEARYWEAFLAQLLQSIADSAAADITLVLWGRIARLVQDMPASAAYRQLVCEHPYNISFIGNPDMQALFADLRILQKAS